MTVDRHPSEPRFARAGANPTLETLEHIRSALTAEREPVSRNRLLAILASWGHTTTRRSLNAGLEFFAALGVVTEGPEGLRWVSLSTPRPTAASQR